MRLPGNPAHRESKRFTGNLETSAVPAAGRWRVVRTVIELSVLAAGAVLGGTVGIGTLAYALAIGPLTHLLLPRLAMRR